MIINTGALKVTIRNTQEIENDAHLEKFLKMKFSLNVFVENFEKHINKYQRTSG